MGNMRFLKECFRINFIVECVIFLCSFFFRMLLFILFFVSFF